MLIDTHTHLYLPEFDNDRDEVMHRALQAGVSHLIFPNVGLDTVEPMKKMTACYPNNISMAMGLHPTEINERWSENLQQIIAETDSDCNYVAIGEIGIDLYWDKTYQEEQMQAFDQQVSEAEKRDLPIIIHCRDGLNQALEVLQGHKNARGVFHSFGGTIDDVNKIRRVGDYHFGINGIVTFKNCKVRDALQEITVERLLLETDAPYLAPVPYRGKRNETSYMVNTAKYIADAMDLHLEEMAHATSQNALSLFSRISRQGLDK